MDKIYKNRIFNWIFGVICTILVVIIIIPYVNPKESDEDSIESLNPINSPQSLIDSIYTEILIMRIEHPTIVFAQVLLETGYLTSDLFISNNNLFGMKASGSRATTSNVIVNGYKYYPTWRESLIDYALLQMAFYRRIDEDEYFKRLSSSYASDPNYIKKIQNIQKTLK